MSPEFTFENPPLLMTQTQQVAHIYLLFSHIKKKFGSFCSSVHRNATSPHTLVKNTGIQYKKLVRVEDHVTCECNPHKHPQTECKQSLAWLSIQTGVHEFEKCVVFHCTIMKQKLATML